MEKLKIEKKQKQNDTITIRMSGETFDKINKNGA